MLASALFVWAYWNSWSTQWLGGAMAAALFTLGTGFVVMGHHVLPGGTYVEARPPLVSSTDEQLAFEEDFTRAHTFGRRRFVLLGAAGAFGAFAVAALAPIRSLGTRPDDLLKHTPWRRGLHAVNDSGVPVRATDIPVGGSVVVFPEGAVNSADGQAVLIRVSNSIASDAKVPPATDNLYAYSNVCTHVGCPLGQYLAQTHQLMCPCHQSVFDVLDAGKPTFGPAGRHLPTLPISIAPDGTIVADGDFSGPVGPGFWSLG